MTSTTKAPDSDHAILLKHPPGYRLRRGRNWFFLGLTYASYYICRYNIGAIAPELKEGLGFTNEQYGGIQAGRDGAYGIGQFFNGLFADRIGGKQAMTIGAIGTIIFNLAFGLTAWSNISWLFYVLLVIRMADGYVQAFGAPGMVKINAAWFLRRERGGFAGIFGGMIQLGAIGANKLGALLKTGFAVPLLFFSITIPKLDWRYMFIIPPAIVFVIIILMNLLVKNHPEDAGYRIVHEDEDAADDPHAHLRIGEVFARIASNPIAWTVAVAYLCTGFVRRAIESWFAVYLDEVWDAGKTSWMYWILGTFLPLAAFAGSLSSGLISDKLVRGRRSPVAAVLYGSEAVLIAIALLLSVTGNMTTPAVAIVLLLALNVTCNSTHSILGTAAVMDMGGRKMSGFSLGLIDMFQYMGAVQATWGVGVLLDKFGHARPAAGRLAETAASTAHAAGGQLHVMFNPTVWFASMLPFAILGAVLMLYLSIRYRNSDVRGT